MVPSTATVRANAVHNSVITSAPKYGSGENNAVAMAARRPAVSPATRRPSAYTSTVSAANTNACATATASWLVPARR
jgi:hypothetical protein